MKKRGVELALSTIVIAAICLVVLIVVLAIFTNGFGLGWDGLRGLSSCKNTGGGTGECQDRDFVENNPDYNCLYKYGGCPDEGSNNYCCWSKTKES
ncbi:hypothetical protein KY320_03675 [Candidatus Woesearchaeota archaeon]|nr:hypothetical protein [Candidatus Woesearchaeota archaeon]